MTSDRFISSLRARWPGARTLRLDDPADIEALTFELDGEDGPVQGALARTGRTLILEYGSARDLAALVVWFRSLSPASDDLVMCNEGGGAYALLTPQTVLAEVVAVLR